MKCVLCKHEKTTDHFYRDSRSHLSKQLCRTCDRCRSRNKIANKKFRDEKYRERINNKYRTDEIFRVKTLKRCKARRDRDPIHVFVLTTLAKHIREGKILEITSEQVEDLCKSTKECKICGTMIQYGAPPRTPGLPSLDRINNEKVMTMKNIQIICARCNYSKADRSMEEFINYCGLVIQRHSILSPMFLSRKH